MADQPTRMEAALDSAARIFNALHRQTDLPDLPLTPTGPDRAWLEIRCFELVFRSQEAALQAEMYLTDQLCEATALGQTVQVQGAPYALAVAAAAAAGLDNLTAISSCTDDAPG